MPAFHTAANNPHGLATGPLRTFAASGLKEAEEVVQLVEASAACA